MALHSPFQVKNVRLFIAFRIFFNARFYYPVFTILFLDYGLSIEQFSLLNTVWAITIVLAEVPSGALADLFGRKRLLVLTSFLMILELGIIAFIPINNINLVFWAFLLNRIFSGLAEAMASGADEAIAYDSLLEHQLQDSWPSVLSVQMRLKALAGVISMTLGALVYDPVVVNRVLEWGGFAGVVDQQTSMRFPVYLTLLLGLGALWTTLSFREIPNSFSRNQHEISFAAVWEAGRLTLQAGKWILQTPFALAIILFGMLYDHLLRLVITLTSQYFRLIALPEASFGVIMATLSLLGLIVPKFAEVMVQKFSAAQNAMWLALLTITTLWGLSGFFAYIGVIPMATVMVGLMLTAFFTSHYLNQITSSDQRATVLSFKGMAFNLAYGIIGVFFAMLMYQQRMWTRQQHESWTAALIENEAFRRSFQWFPWYGIGLTAIIAYICYRLLKKSKFYQNL